MRALVVFHSVCGNVYYMAKHYRDALALCGVKADLYRVSDDAISELAQMLGADMSVVREIKEIPVWNATDRLYADYDALFLGSPTYFGTVSAQVKAFMDGFLALYSEQRPYGFPFGAFTAYSSAQGGQQLCLQTMNTFAMHMGMNVITVPGELQCAPMAAYGAAHCSGDNSDIRPGGELFTAIDRYIARFVENAAL